MGEELHRNQNGRVSWLRPTHDVTIDGHIDLTSPPDDESVDDVDPEPLVLDRARLFTTNTDRLIGTGEPEPPGRVLGGKRRRRILRRAR